KIDSGYTLGSLESVVKSFGGKIKDVKKAEKYLMVINQKRELKEGYKKDFFESIKKDVISVSNDTGILPSVILGQAALESNWGRSSLASNYNNLFGIKADSSWKGEKVNLPTSEYYNTKIKDDFRVYNNLGGSIKDFGQFLMNNARYKKSGVFKAKTYKEQIIAIENAGYSTITNEKGKKVYADYVTDIIISNDLQVIDSEVKGEE
ncbi:MAG: glucosaminidase domain-containing protein, partial [Clostridium sp.]